MKKMTLVVFFFLVILLGGCATLKDPRPVGEVRSGKDRVVREVQYLIPYLTGARP